MVESSTSQFRFRAEPIEKVLMKGIEISLVSSGDGVEIIHHKLKRGTEWSLVPQQGWTAFEHFSILTGKLRCESHDNRLLQAGDSFSACPVDTYVLFKAETDVEFLYVSSQPVFHYYSRQIKEQMDLAVAVEQKDGYTADHCFRIKDLSMQLGRIIGLSVNELVHLNLGSFLHDIGKVKIPEEILCKPGKLTPEEWDVMRKHPIFGRDMLRDTGLPTLESASVIVEQHHERFNGSGYPYGLRGDDIHIGARIVAVVDSFDAMISDRVYQKGRSKQEALDEIRRCRGTLYDPEIVDEFLSIFSYSGQEIE